MKKLTKKERMTLSVELHDNEGFTLWVKEKTMVGKKMKEVEHWVLDGSLIKETATITFGSDAYWNINAVYNKDENVIEIVKKK